VIRALSEPGPGLTLAEVARATGLTRAAARRFLLTLQTLGYVRGDGRLFSLSPRVLELGYAYLSALSLPEIAAPHLEALVAEVHESSSVSVLDGAEIVYVARVPTRRIMRLAINVGTRLPALLTSMGRVLIAHADAEEVDALLASDAPQAVTDRTLTSREDLRRALDRARRQGWAIVYQELDEGLRSVAAPIRDRAGDVVAAVNVSTHASRTTLEEMRRELLPPLLRTAEEIGEELG
jgi:IclR family transcriptional regulator, pca regulon regulatory protein